MPKLNLDTIHPSWLSAVNIALQKLAPSYLEWLETHSQWLPGPDKLFNAFSIPLQNVQYILFGESPYPRAESANGFAFFDAAVTNLWSPTGLSKAVNRATSLRNIIKMLLVARGNLSPTDITQQKISQISKTDLVSTLPALFENFQKHGFMLLNASLTLTSLGVKKDASAWQPFMEAILSYLAEHKSNTQLILFGQIAKQIQAFPSTRHFEQFSVEHPYNISFVTHPAVLDFFKPFDLLHV